MRTVVEFTIRVTMFQDPVIPDEMTWIYPLWRQLLKFFTSFSVLIVMVSAGLTPSMPNESPVPLKYWWPFASIWLTRLPVCNCLCV